jgi:hypothetical protein
MLAHLDTVLDTGKIMTLWLMSIYLLWCTLWAILFFRHSLTLVVREYLMYYKEPGFHAFVGFGSFPLPLYSPVSKFSGLGKEPNHMTALKCLKNSLLVILY